ncbi:hypothetical protein H5410_012343 [Solanum commersonii]|uniref:Uncharacterized protein n=1 Tax=Solanum commersonii TaxID=4109 RepID=A0A9J6AR92_SOLCO|nr:hypothetical protein H5410_012343 [Solanum commersonii]
MEYSDIKMRTSPVFDIAICAMDNMIKPLVKIDASKTPTRLAARSLFDGFINPQFYDLPSSEENCYLTRCAEGFVQTTGDRCHYGPLIWRLFQWLHKDLFWTLGEAGKFIARVVSCKCNKLTVAITNNKKEKITCFNKFNALISVSSQHSVYSW